MAGDISPDAVSKDHERFKQKFSRFLKGSERLKLATNKEQFEQNLRVLGEDDSPELGQVAVDEFRIAAGTLLSYQQKRTHGFRGANRALQDSLVAVSRFVAAYSSILDAVSQAAGPYATVGYQTMTILLIVVVTKRKNDKKIKTHLETIRQILPRLERWKGTYNHKAMQQVVFDTYLAVINFSRAAVEYFSHAWKRILSSVFPHVMDEFEEAAKLIYVTLAKVNAEANQSLHERSRQIQDDLSKLRIETRELKATLDARVQQDEIRDKQVDEDSFAEFESLFQPNLAMDTSRLDVADAALASHPCFDLSLAKSSLQAAFPNVTEYDKRKHWSLYTQLAPANILNDDSFKLWSNSGSSSLLFIHGRTMRDGRARTFQSPCWLSPAAIHIFEHLRHQNTPQDTIIYLSCRPDAEYHIEQSADVLSMVALRLISTRKQMLRSRLREFRSLVSPKSSTPLGTPSPSWSNSDRGLGLSSLSYVSSDMHHSPEEYHVEWNNEPAEKQVRRPDLRQLASLLSQVLVELATSQAQELNEKSQGPATAVILLDRLEYVDNGKFQKIMNQLARLVAEDALFRVKIVVVVEDSLAEATWRKDMLPFTSDRIHEFKLDQRRLERHEVLAGEPSLIWNGTE